LVLRWSKRCSTRSLYTWWWLRRLRLREVLVPVAREMEARAAMAAAVMMAGPGEDHSSGGVVFLISAPGQVASFRRGVAGQVALCSWERRSGGAYHRWTGLRQSRSKVLRLWRRLRAVRVSLRPWSTKVGLALDQWTKGGSMHLLDRRLLRDQTLRRW
jgi:hypothetical protein